MAGYYVENFGCRANQADGEAIAAELNRRGLDRATDLAAADVVILNTCTVTATADRTARSFLRRVHRLNPGARILMTGCYAQRDPTALAGLPGVSSVVGNSHKLLVPQIAADLGCAAVAGRAAGASRTDPGDQPRAAEPPVLVDDAFAHSSLAQLMPGIDHGRAGGARRRTRPNLKVQDGCGNRCSFCIIPTTRGQSRSLPIDESLNAIRSFVAEGGEELVLSGINLGRWRRDLDPKQAFEDLVEAALTQTGLPRLRLSSIEPMDWTPRLLSLYREYAHDPAPRLARHAHLPLQSGADAILRAMHRRYRPWHYAAKLDAIRREMPDAAIGADVMVGFPGESRALFEENFAFIRARPFTYLHLFPFSARPGTMGWRLQQEAPVPAEEVRERMRRLQEWIGSAGLQFRRSFQGRDLSAVTLRASDTEVGRDWTRALTDNSLEIRLRAKLEPNRMILAKVAAITEDGLEGIPVASN